MTQEPNAEPSGPTLEPAGPRRRSRAGKTIAVLTLLLLGSTAAATFPLWRDQAGFPSRTDAELAQLRAALAAANDRLSQLESSLTQPGDSGLFGRIAGLEQKVEKLGAEPQLPDSLLREIESITRQIHDIRRTVGERDSFARLPGDVEELTRQVTDLKKTSADAATLLRLFDRVDQAETALRALQARRASASALLLAVGQLREVVNLGLPYDSEWRAARALAGEDAEALAALESFRATAERGVPPRTALLNRFEQVAPHIVRAEMLPEEHGWSRRTADRILSLVSIRREAGVVAGNDAGAIVARAEAAIQAGDLPGAVAEVELLVYGPAEAAAGWLADAKARLAVDKSLSELTAHSIALAGARP